MSEIAANARAEANWYLPVTRQQFRLRGVLSLVTKDATSEFDLEERVAAWRRMSDSGRAAFSRSEVPEREADERSLNRPPSLHADAPVEGSFVLVRFKIDGGELLDLIADKTTKF